VKYPNFFIVGTAKAGTTSLWKFLNENNEVFVIGAGNELFKEPCYFSGLYDNMTLEEYLNFLDGASEQQTHVGDVSTIYLPDPKSAERIYEFNPDAKIVIVLRNPAERAFSLYNWMVQEGYEYSSTFEKALEKEQQKIRKEVSNFCEPCQSYRLHMYYSSGLYCEQVRKYLALFGDQVLIIKFDRLKNNFTDAYEEICCFLGIEVNQITPVSYNASVGVYSPKIQFILRIINSIANKAAVRIFKKEFKTKSSRDWLVRMGLNEKKPLKMREDTRNMLIEKYSEDIRNLSKMTGIYFDDWITEEKTKQR